MNRTSDVRPRTSGVGIPAFGQNSTVMMVEIGFAEVRGPMSEVRVLVAAGVGLAGHQYWAAAGLLTASSEGEQDAVDGRVRSKDSESNNRDDGEKDDNCLQ